MMLAGVFTLSDLAHAGLSSGIEMRCLTSGFSIEDVNEST